MKRLVYQQLKEWKQSSNRKPLLVRGARQVGKTHAVRHLSKDFEQFVEINFEYEPVYCDVFATDYNPQRVVQEIAVLSKKRIVAGKTLLFFDEIQACPAAVTALRYFYEKMPELHVIAAGSLLEFANELLGVPVGRVQSLYVYPLTFLEYLRAEEEPMLIEHIVSERVISSAVHKKLLKYVGTYVALGGMPHVVAHWIRSRDPLEVAHIHDTLLDTYRQDFRKYAKKHQIKYLSLLFDMIPLQIGQKFKFSAVGEYRKRELQPALDLLTTANIVHTVTHSSAQGEPIGAGAVLDRFKLLFLDVGLTQALLNLDAAEWFVHMEKQFVNKGQIIEAFVGQELLAYSNPFTRNFLYYWHREQRNSAAEIDYLCQREGSIIPIEVKSGHQGKLKSLWAFLASHPNVPYGIKVDIHNHSPSEQVKTLPLYAVARLAHKNCSLSSLFE